MQPPAGFNELIGEESLGLSSFGTLRRKISQAEIDLYSDMLAEIRWHPHFGVIVLVDDGCEAIARARNTIASVCRQAYANWRLVLVGDDSAVDMRDRLADGRDDVRTLLDRLLDHTGDWEALSTRALDGFDQFRQRIEVLELGGTEPLYRLAGCGADLPAYLGILAAGDELGCDALLELAVASGLSRDCDFFYSDELCVNPATGMLQEFFKPQWSPDLLLSTNYIGRFWCAKRELLERTKITVADLLRFGEYDVVLRCAEQSHGFGHVPSLLCRSPARRLDSQAGMKLSLERALERRGIEGEVAAGYGPGTYRLKRRVARDVVSIIIATCGSRGLIKPCITSLRETTAYSNFEIICLDNIPAPDQDLKDWLRVNADKVIEIDEAFNWSYFNNRGVAAADGQLLLFLNDDIEIIDPGWLEALVGHAQRPEVGVVGAQLLFPNRTVQHGGMFLAKLGHARHAFRHRRQNDPGYFGLALMERDVSAVTGACMMTRREIFADLGGFNEAHDIINNDLDYCLKARARGLLCVFTPYARIVHHERASRKAREDYDDDAFNRHWWTVFGEHDPYHHPRLSREIDDIVPEAEPVQVFHIAPPLFASQSVCKILLLELDDIDGCIGSIRAIRRLREAFPSARLYVLGGSSSQPVWSQVSEVDQFIAFDFISVNPLSTFKTPDAEACRDLRQRLQPYQFDIAIDLHSCGATRPVLQCTGALYLAGFEHDSKFPWLDIALQWDGNIPDPIKLRHFSGDLVSLVSAVALERETRRASIVDPPTGCSPSAGLRLANSLDGPLACVHPAAGDEVRRWPSEYFAELADLLVDRNGAHVALLGLPGEEEIVTRVHRRLRNCSHVSNLAGMLEFSDLIDLVKKSALFVGNNSGLLHLAAGLGVPTVGIHSAILDPRVSGPMGPRAVAIWRHVRCSACGFSRPEQCNRNLLCLTGLRPVDVYPVCKRFLTIWAGRTAAHCHGGCSQEFEEERVDWDK